MGYYRGEFRGFTPGEIVNVYERWYSQTPVLNMMYIGDCDCSSNINAINSKLMFKEWMNYVIYHLDDFDWIGNMLKSAPLSPYPSYKFFKYHPCEYTIHHEIKPLSSVLPLYIKYFIKVSYDIELSYLNSKIIKNLNDVFGEKYFERERMDYLYDYNIQCVISVFPLTIDTELFGLVVRRLKQKIESSQSIVIFYHDTKAHQETMKLEDIEYCKQLKRKRGK